jgi:hypothetical protein
MRFARRKLAIGATGIAVLSGAGGAFAATQQKSGSTRPDPAVEQKAFLDDLAKRLNVTTDQLDSAIKGAASDRIDAAVAAGTLTKAQGDAAKQRIASGTGVPLLGGGPGFGHGPGGPRGGGFPGGPGGPGPGGPGPRGGAFFGALDGASAYLGLTDAQLRKQLESGKSLADIAKANGKTTDGLKAAITAATKAKLDQAVTDKKLTDAQRTQILSGLDKRLDALISGKPGARDSRVGPGRPHWR